MSLRTRRILAVIAAMMTAFVATRRRRKGCGPADDGSWHPVERTTGR